MTAIEWTDTTWNPVTGCTEVSEACDHCYARTFAERWRGIPGHPYEQGFDLRLWPERLPKPLRWRQPRRVFVNSMSDLFHAGVPDSFIAGVFATMAATPQHTYQVLTKRPGRMRSLLSSPEFPPLVAQVARELPTGALAAGPLPNVWLGVSVESQRWANIRIPILLDTPAAVRWLSCEPLLGPVDLATLTTRAGTVDALMGNKDWERTLGGERTAAINPRPLPQVDWVVVGGESGAYARPIDPQWARELRDRCQAAGVPFFFKQWGGRTPKAGGRDLDGRTWDQYPPAVPA